MASTVWAVEDLVVEDGEVECETETDGVCGGELGNSNVGSGLVGLEGLVCAVLALVASSELSEVTVVVTHPEYCEATHQPANHHVKCQHLRTSCGRRPWTRQRLLRG